MTIFEDITELKVIPNDSSLLLPIYDNGVIVGHEATWVNFNPAKKGLAQLDSIPVTRTDLHLYDWVSYRFNRDGEAVCTGLVEASGYRTLRISLWRASSDPEATFARAGIGRSLNAMGLDWTREDDLVVAAIPPSYSAARLDALKFRCPDLRFERV